MAAGLTKSAVTFVGPRRVEVQQDEVSGPGPGRVLVRTRLSAISAGTELLVYRGEAPTEMAADESIAALRDDLSFPIRYGYAAVGDLVEVGEGVDPDLFGRRVFAFNPHESLFEAEPQSLMEIPAGVSYEDAVMLPSIETAVNFAMDGAPLVGENVLIIGQGAIGLLTTAVLAQIPLASLITLDTVEARREASLRLGASAALNPESPAVMDEIAAAFGGHGADLVFESSGRPEALDTAIAVTGYGGRIVIGSWYGTKRAPIDLGGSFHRSRIKLISSQVTTIAPELSGRWDKRRRFETAWQMVERLNPSQLVTHRFPIEDAADAYRLLDESSGDALQVLLTYDNV
ncbi:MAG: zinc-binding alcohol dehydrogenase [Dehalococcoidia bacterium]|nr:zinc-binding alcohol dehydrogenase [Dehalococcoidia bacterium]